MVLNDDDYAPLYGGPINKDDQDEDGSDDQEEAPSEKKRRKMKT